MPITADGIHELMELGISGDQLLAVVAVFERDAERIALMTPSDSSSDASDSASDSSSDASDSASDVSDGASGDGSDGKRTKAAIYSRNYRIRQRAKRLSSSDSASDSASDSSSDASDFTAKPLTELEKKKAYQLSREEEKGKKALQESKEEKKGKNTELRARARQKPRQKTPFPEDFQPKTSHFEKSREYGRDDQFVWEKLEDLRIWALSKGELKADWDMTLHGFIRRDANQGQGNGYGSRNQNNRYNDDNRPGSGIDFLAELAGRKTPTAPRYPERPSYSGGPTINLVGREVAPESDPAPANWNRRTG